MSNSTSSAKHTAGPFDPVFAAARKHIQTAVVEHCGTGADLDRCCGDAAQKILGEIFAAAMHFNPDGSFAAWKRMPPALRAAISKAQGGAS